MQGWRSTARRMVCALVACAVAWAPVAHAAAPLAGSRIDNAARATYFDTDRGFNTTLDSNPVSAVVQPLERLAFDAALDMVRPQGAIVSLPHRLTNSGNTPSSVTLRFANQPGDDHNLNALRLVRDLNGNGVADSGEPALADGALLGVLAPGESTALVIEGQVASNAASGTSARVMLSATSAAQGASAQVVDSVGVGSGAALRLTKTASRSDPKPNEALEFTLVANNVGVQPARGIPVVVDGVARSLVVLRDVVPANTSFSSFGPAGDARALLHLAGQPEHVYQTEAPTDLRQVDAIAFGWDQPLAPGASHSRSFAVRVHPNAAGEIVNAAQIRFDAGAQSSNTLRLPLPAQVARLGLFVDAAYTQAPASIDRGAPLYVMLDAARCNADPLRAEVVTLTLRTQLAQDVEALGATETAPNSGVFRIEPHVPTRDVGTGRGTPGDGVLGVRADDEISVEAPACGGTAVKAGVKVDPFGVVFDSKTNAPVAGARVSLVHGDGSTMGAPAAVITGVDGVYRLPAVATGTWRVVVQPPTRYVYPSTLATDLLPPGRTVLDVVSYGKAFDMGPAAAPVSADIPLDALTQIDLRVEKFASRTTVDVGDVVDYRVKVRNVSGQLLGRIVVHDQLPPGFAYQRGSARLEGRAPRLDGSALPEPDGGSGPALGFHVGSIEDGATLTLHYRARVGIAALQGDGTNRAYAVSDGALDKQSNAARVTVRVLPGVFDTRGVVLGNVFADCNRDGRQNEDEPGVPGVRLWLEDGTHATTDGQGRWSLYGLRAITHVVKVDATTLPAAARLRVLDNRHAGDAASRFVDSKNGELQRADFALDGCTPALLETIRSRVIAQAGQEGEVGLERTAQALTQAPIAPVDARAAPAAGIVGVTATPARIADPRASSATATSSSDAPWDAARIAALEPGTGFVNLTANQVLPRAQTAVLLQGPIDAALGLEVNGKAVPADRIGRRIRIAERGMQVIEYVGVTLAPGRNQLALTGAGRAVEIQVTAPGPFARLRLTLPQVPANGDARAPVPVTIETLDTHGVTVTAPTPVTLDATAGRWLIRDLDPREPGTQVFVEGGRLVVSLEPPEQSGAVQLYASSGDINAHADVAFGPALRPMLAAGIVEGTLSLRRLDPRAIQTARAQDGFEDELRIAADTLDGRGRFGARAALFLKGTVRGDTLLTLAYDSDKPTRERLFRDIQPDEHYPIYGDSAVKGFDAQSTGRLYVRVERGRSFVLYGDFNTEPPSVGTAQPDERRLGRYQRALNGVQAQAQGDHASITTFASRTTSRQRVDELPGLGTSGPYLLSRAPIVENSESVEIVERERDSAGRVLRRRTLQRFVDYQVNALTGSVLLAAPLASLTDNFDPQSLRVVYETEGDGSAAWVRGVNARTALDANVSAGASWVRDDDPLAPFMLASGSFTVKNPEPRSAAEPTTMVLELARSEAPNVSTALGFAVGPGNGLAARAEARHDEGPLQWQAQAVKAAPGFANPSAGITPGRDEATAKATYALTAGTRLEAEAQHAADATYDANRSAVRFGVSQRITDELRGEVGVQASRFDAGTLPSAIASDGASHYSLLGRVIAVPAAWPLLSLSFELEQDVVDGDRHAARIGVDYRLARGGRLYLRHELANSLATVPSLDAAAQRNATVIGVAADIARDAQWSSEYRVRDALEGRSAEAAVGLRNRWRLGEGWNASTALERVHVFSGPGSTSAERGAGESVAATGGVDYVGSPDWKAAARLEWRNGASLATQLAGLAAAWRLNDEWTALAKAQFMLADAQAAADRRQRREQIGLAWREGGLRRSNVLLRLEDVRDVTGADPAGLNPAQRRHSTIASSHLHHQPRPGLQFSGRWAARVSRDVRDGLTSSEYAQMAGLRMTRDLGEAWDMGVQASVWQGGQRERKHGLGVELGHRLAQNLWVVGGWNILGFEDRELAGADHTQRGVYLRLRIKFDESWFEGLR